MNEVVTFHVLLTEMIVGIVTFCVMSTGQGHFFVVVRFHVRLTETFVLVFFGLSHQRFDVLPAAAQPSCKKYLQLAIDTCSLTANNHLHMWSSRFISGREERIFLIFF